MSACAVSKRPFDSLIESPFGHPTDVHLVGAHFAPAKRVRPASPTDGSMSPSSPPSAGASASSSMSPIRGSPSPAVRRTASAAHSPYLPSGTMGPVDVDAVIESVSRKRVRHLDVSESSMAASSSAIASALSSSSLASMIHVPSSAHVHSHSPSASAAASASSSNPALNEPRFPLSLVRAIVAKALEEKEANMREEFNVIMRHTLTEQFEIFTKVNEDFISRQMRNSTYDYMS